MITKGDKILIITIILISVAIFAGIQIYGFAEGKFYAVIEVDGKLYEKVSLGEKGPDLKLTVPVEHGESTVEISKNKVRMLYSDCPDGDCIRQGWIDKPGQIIVCLPNKVVIKIESDRSAERDIDGVSY